MPSRRPSAAAEMEDASKRKLPDHLKLQRTRVICEANAPLYLLPLMTSRVGEATRPPESGDPPWIGPEVAIELEAHAAKGAGKVHAKWFPVATAWYRMLPEPEVVLLNEIKRNDAENLVKGEKRVAVARSRACTLCRECVQKATKDEVDQVEDEVHQVEIRLARDHFIFTVESAGSLPPEVIFTEAVKILEEKCEKVMSELS
ncbi:hypothetical protein ACP70R_049700 [Stipagrostis hirtigluma subsp. patula]